MSRYLLILVFLCQHIAMASEPIVWHLPDESHSSLVSVKQPHNHADHHDEHDGGPVFLYWTNMSSFLDIEADAYDSSSHEHSKHMHGHADIPTQGLTFAASTNGGECYLHHNSLTSITLTPPVPPPNSLS